MGDINRAANPTAIDGMAQGPQGMAQGPMGAMVGGSTGAADGMQRAAQGGMTPNPVSELLALLIPALGSIFTVPPQQPQQPQQPKRPM
jgi:hypothetical protein